MKTVPAIALIAVASGIGGYLLWKFLKGERNNPYLIGVHLLLGLAAFELTAMLIHGAPDGARVALSSATTALLAALGAAALTGLLAPIIGRQSRTSGTVMLYGHAGIGALALGLLLWWTTSF